MLWWYYDTQVTECYLFLQCLVVACVDYPSVFCLEKKYELIIAEKGNIENLGMELHSNLYHRNM